MHQHIELCLLHSCNSQALIGLRELNLPSDFSAAPQRLLALHHVLVDAYPHACLGAQCRKAQPIGRIKLKPGRPGLPALLQHAGVLADCLRQQGAQALRLRGLHRSRPMNERKHKACKRHTGPQAVEQECFGIQFNLYLNP